MRRLASRGGEGFNWPRANLLETWGQDGFCFHNLSTSFKREIRFGWTSVFPNTRNPDCFLLFFSELFLGGAANLLLCFEGCSFQNHALRLDSLHVWRCPPY